MFPANQLPQVASYLTIYGSHFPNYNQCSPGSANQLAMNIAISITVIFRRSIAILYNYIVIAIYMQCQL